MKNRFLTILASDPTVYAFAQPHELVTVEAASALPSEIVWMPIGEHSIRAGTTSGKTFVGKVRVTEEGARAAQASLLRATAAGRKPWIDFNHADGEAAAWVKGFSWDPARGIIASLEWTPGGEAALRDKKFRSFSPAFKLDRETGLVAGINEGFAAGGLVNAPAFGAAMPALIAARLAGAETANPASGGTGFQNQNTMTRQQLIELLARLGIKHATDATDEQLVALVAAYQPAAPNAELNAIKANLATIQDSLKDAKKKVAKAHVDAAILRGAIKKEETAVIAFWQAALELDELTALASLNSIPSAKKEAGAVIIATHVDNDSRPEITVRANAVEVLKAMHAEKDHLKQGGIYRDFRPIIIAAEQRGEDIGAILANNSLGTLTSTVVALRCLDLLKLKFPILGRISTDYSSEAVNLNQTVTSRLITVPSVGTYNTSTGYSTQDATSTDVSVVINQHKHVQIALNAEEAAGTSRNIFSEQAGAMAYAMAKNLVDALYALFVIATYTNAITVATNSITRITSPLAIAAALNSRGVRDDLRTLLLNQAAFTKLSEDSTIMNLAANQRADLITEYALPKVHGLQPIEAVNLPSTGNMTGFALAPDAAMIATRLPSDYTKILPGSAHGAVSVVTNPDVGISMMKVDYIDHTLGRAISRLAWMYGVAAGNPASAQLQKSS